MLVPELHASWVPKDGMLGSVYSIMMSGDMNSSESMGILMKRILVCCKNNRVIIVLSIVGFVGSLVLVSVSSRNTA